MHQPTIAITMGDAAGVGPEIIVKSLARPEIYQRSRPLVIGDATRLRQAAEIVKLDLSIRSLANVDEARYAAGAIDCIDLKIIPPDLPWGQLSAVAGDAAFQFVKIATELAMARQVDAICTAPLNKEALHAGGHFYPGHTELLAALTGTPEVSMMLVAPRLRVIHVTAHMGLIDAIDPHRSAAGRAHHRPRTLSPGKRRNRPAKNRRLRYQSPRRRARNLRLRRRGN